jgi:hypothetical protein
MRWGRDRLEAIQQEGGQRRWRQRARELRLPWFVDDKGIQRVEPECM